MGTFKPRAIDLFCGAGGSSHGAQNAGIEIVAGFDVWEPAIKTFKANFPKSRIFAGDIGKLLPREIKAEIGEIDLILASPECTSHSNARGARKESEQSRKTAHQVLFFARVFMPTWIVIENVVEMQAWTGYGRLIRLIKKLGYFVTDDIILNAQDFGVPQSRERLFILCSLQKQPDRPVSGNHNPIAAATIIEENTYTFTPLKKPGRAQETMEKAKRAISVIGPDEPFLLVYYGSDKSGKGGWQRIEEPLRTITTLDRFAYVTPGKDGHLMRMLQPEELKRAMGFNPDFKLASVEGLTRRDRVKLMGNGVCPPVMEAIVTSLIRQNNNHTSAKEKCPKQELSEPIIIQ